MADKNGSYQLTIFAIDATTTVVAKINKSFAEQFKFLDKINKSAKALGKELSRTARITGLTSITRDMKRFGGQIGEVAKTTTKLIGGLGILTGAASAAGIAALASKFSTFNFNLTNNARAIGVSAGALEKFQNFASLAGLSTEAATSGLAGLGQVMEDAVNGRAPEALSMFNQLGINIHGIGVFAKDPIAILPELNAKFSAMGDSAGAAAAKMQLAGKLGLTDLMPILNLAPAQFDKYMKAVDYYSTRNKAGAAAAERLRYQQALLGLAVQHFGYALSEALEPALTAVSQAIVPLVNSMSDWLVVNKKWINTKIHEAIDLVKESVMAIWTPLNNMVKEWTSWKTVLIVIGSVLASSFALKMARFFISPMIIALKVIRVLTLYGVWPLIKVIYKLGAALVSLAIANPVVTLIAAAILAIGVAAYEIYQHWDAIAPWLVEKWNWLKDTTVAIGDSIAKTWHETWTTVKDGFWAIWQPLVNKFKDAWKSVGTFFDDLWEGIIGKFQAAYDKLGEVVNKLVDAHLLPQSFHIGGTGAGGQVEPGVSYQPGQVLTEMGISSNQYDAFKGAVADIEHARYDQMGGAHSMYAGRYQMGHNEISEAAQSLGEAAPTQAQFLADPAMQERYFEAYTRQHYQQLMKDSPQFRGMTPEQRLQVLGYAHNQGAGGATGWLNRGMTAPGHDANNTNAMDYYNRVARALGQAPHMEPYGPIAPGGRDTTVHIKIDWGNVPIGMRTSAAGGPGTRISQSRTAGPLLT